MSKSKKTMSFAEHSPELVSEWNFDKNIDITPESISYGSARKIWWKCSQGHEWESTPNKRSSGRGCPKCAQDHRLATRRKNIVAKRGSLAEQNPELARQWHPTKNKSLTPNDITKNSPKKVWWMCPKKHEWCAAINSRNSGVGCPVCSGHKLVVGINDLATVNSALADEWHPVKNGDLKPSDVVLHNKAKVWWVCAKGHEWSARIYNRAEGTGCPICSNKKVLVGYNDLASIMPLLSKEWHPTKNGDLTPQDVTVRSNKKVWWMCEKGHEWQSVINKRSDGRRCPKCYGETKTSFPEQAIFFYSRQFDIAYNRYMIDSRTEIDVYLPEYKIGIEYDGVYYHKGEKAKEREIRKQEKLAALDIKLIRVREFEEQTDAISVYVKPGANDEELGHAIEKIFGIVFGLTGIEAKLDIDVSRDRNKIYEQYVQGEKERSLATVHPALASEWHPTKNGRVIPEYVGYRSNKKVWWQCANGHEWEATISSRSKGAGCALCYRMRRKAK